MNIIQYEQHMHEIEDARRYYYRVLAECDRIQENTQDTEQLKAAKERLFTAKARFVVAKSKMAMAVEQIQL